jgi:DNA-binding beta-propeller fold protein YncE
LKKFVNRTIQRLLQDNNPGRFMKNANLLRVGQESVAARWFGLLAIAVLLPLAVSLQAQTPTITETTVTTSGGGPQYYNPGHNFGSSNSVYGTLYSQFHTPSGIAYDSFQGFLYVADRDNNAIRLIDRSINPSEIFTFAPDPPYVPTNLISQPVGVAVDALSDVFVLNRGNGVNGTVVEFDYLGNLIATNMTRLTNASGIALDTIGDIYVTTRNTVFKITPAGVSNVVVTITNAGTFLQGIVVKRSGPSAGWLAVCDSGRNGIYLVDPTSGIIKTNAGFNGAGDGTGNRNQGVLNASARFFQPSGIAEAGDGSLIVTDFGNHRVKVVTVTGLTTNLYGVASNYWWTGTTPTGGTALKGWSDGAVWEPDGGLGNVQARQPFGVAIGPDGTVYTTEDYYHIIRKVTGANIQVPPPWPPLPPTGLAATAGYGQVVLTWNPSLGATNYNIKRSTVSGNEITIASTSSTNYTDLNVASGTTYYYVVSAVNANGEGINSAEVSATPPPPFFNNPTGIALDPSGTSLYIADYTNNAVEKLNLLNNQTTHFLTSNNGISHPVSVMVDTNNNLYVLNQNAGTNGSVLEFDIFGNLLETNVIGLNQPTALTMDANGNIFITEQAGSVTVVSPSGLTNTIADININANVQLAGIALFDDGTIAVSDAGNHVIWRVNAITKTFSRLTGQLGISGTTLGSSNFAKLYQPRQISRAGGDQLVVADSGNNRLVTVTRSGSITNVLVSTNSLVWFGTTNDPVTGSLVPMALPLGVAVSSSGLVYDSEPTNAAVRQLSAPLTPPSTAPSVILPAFAEPRGIAFDNVGNYLFIADYNHNAVQILDLTANVTSTFLTTGRGISNPVSVLVDANENVYVLNQGTPGNGSVLKFDIHGNAYGPVVTGLNQPTAFAFDGYGNLFVAEQGGQVWAFGSGISNEIATVTHANVSLQGIAIFDDGTIAVSDAGNHVIWAVNPITKLVTQLTGQLGVSGAAVGASYFAQLNQPHQLARVGGNQIIAADQGNNRLVLVQRNGTVITNNTTYHLDSSVANIWFGRSGDPVASGSAQFVPMVSPSGVAVGNNGVVFASETYYEDIRGLTGTGVTSPAPGPFDVLPFFNAPAGIAFDSSGSIYGPYGVNNLFIADPANNTVEVLDLDHNFTSTFLSSLDGVTHPTAVLVDTNEYVYVLNQNSGTNGYISAYDIYGNPLGTITTGLKVPTAFTLDAYGNFYVTEQSGSIMVFGAGISNVVIATITNANVSLQGIALFDNGTIAVSDAGNHVIWTVNAVTKNVSLLTGQTGISGTTLGASNFAMLNQPHQLARAGNNQLVVADYGNNRLVTVSSTGYIARALDSTNASVWFGLPGDPIASSNPQFVPMIMPVGVAVGNGTVFASETYFDDVRGLNSSGVTTPTFNPGVPLPIYSEPAGIALNTLGTSLFITDFTNNTIWALNLNNNATSIFLDSSNGIYQPVDVAVDNKDNLYVLNQGTGGNGSILEFDKYGNLLGTNAAALSMPTAMKLSYTNDIFVTERTGLIQKFNVGSSNTLAVINTNGNVRLQGITVLDNRSVVVSDAGNHVLWKIAPGSTNAVLFTGIIGSPGTTLGAAGLARLNTPMRLATAYGGLLAIADSGNNRVVVADDLGTISSALNSTNANLWFGRAIDPVSPSSPYFVPMLSPVGIAIGNSGTVFVSESIYKVIRGLLGTGLRPLPPPPDAPVNLTAVPSYNQVALTWAASLGATNYYIKRAPSSGGPYSIIGTNNLTSYTDASVINGATYYFVVSAVGLGGESFNNSPEVKAIVPTPPPPPPAIGWFDYEGTAPPVTVFHPVSGTPYIAHNDFDSVSLMWLAIEPAADGVSTYYTEDGSTPSPTNGSTPPPYKDGLTSAPSLPVPTPPVPDLTIKAVNVNSGGSSPVVTAEFLFQVANPTIVGNNAAQFTIYDITFGAQLWYATDGSTPDPVTNAASSHLAGTITGTNGITLSLPFPANTNVMTFTVRGFRNGYSPSGNAVQVFSIADFVPNTISFGFASGEASSDFVASPGQTFYAPVTLTTLPSTVMYSLQFNLAVNTGPTNPGPALTNLPAPFGFQSMLMKPIPDTKPVLYTNIPPEMFVSDPNNFTNLVFTNLAEHLLGVGWVERAGKTNLYDTTKQTLITYSMAHDDLFPNAAQPNGVIAGGYSFNVPVNASNGQTYQIQIGRPSATSDGIGAPGSSVYIATPTNGSMAGGAINSIKIVTVGSRKYLVGNVYPFRWFNAGDFGNTNLQNADVEQVFEAAIYSLNAPPPGSDFLDAMDSCGNYGTNNGAGIYSQSTFYTPTHTFRLNDPNEPSLFDGNDTNINQITFGDGMLDECDVYVTYRRSLDPSLNWFHRFWTNGVRVAETTPNVFVSGAAKQSSGGKIQPAVKSNPDPVSITNTPSVNFAAGDFQATAGQPIQIPVTASVFGPYPLRVAMLNITVVPLDGSPALTTPISFSPSAALGAPTSGFIVSDGPGNYAAAWLDSTVAGISSNAAIGTLTVTIPANATSSSAYAIHFDHASGSPNGLASFPNKTFTGLITLSSRNTSSYNDGIPDFWRLRWFGTINNLLSVSNACPSGDGVNNWGKYVAGVDPNTPNDFPSLNPNTPPPSGAAMSIYWPTVSGKHYAILSSASLFPGNWTTNAIVTGTGANMEFDDNSTGATEFYRVLILP